MAKEAATLDFTMGVELVRQEVLQRFRQIRCASWEDCVSQAIRAVRGIADKYSGDIPLVFVADESVRIVFYIRAAPSKFVPIEVVGSAERCGASICISPSIR